MPFIVPIIAEIGVAIAAASSFVTSLGVIGSAIVSAGIGVAASFILGKLLPTKQTGDTVDNTPGGVQLQRQYGTNVPRQVACGLVGISGHDTYLNTFDESNKKVQQIFTLSDYYVTALNRVAINGKYITLGPYDTSNDFGFPVQTGADFDNLIWIKFLDGRQTTADNTLVTNANPPEKWTANSVGYGMAAIVVTMIYDREKNSSFLSLRAHRFTTFARIVQQAAPVRIVGTM